MARWEENKKWQKRVETLKSRVASKTKELEAAQKQIGSLRETIGRLERERVLVQSRAKATASASRLTGQDLVAETSSSRDEKAELRREVFELKQKVRATCKDSGSYCNEILLPRTSLFVKNWRLVHQATYRFGILGA